MITVRIISITSNYNEGAFTSRTKCSNHFGAANYIRNSTIHVVRLIRRGKSTRILVVEEQILKMYWFNFFVQK